MTKVNVISEILIDCPLDQMADYASGPDNAPKWYVNIKSFDWKTPRPAVVGSQIAFVANVLGRRLAYTYEIVELIAGGKLVIRTAEGPFPMETSCTCEATSDTTTRMTLQNRGQPSGFSARMAPLRSAMMRRANRKDLALLKRILEDKSQFDPAP